MNHGWKVQYFVDLEVEISWQAQYLVDLEMEISWQAQYRTLWTLKCRFRSGRSIFCGPSDADFVAGAELCEP